MIDKSYLFKMITITQDEKEKCALKVQRYFCYKKKMAFIS